MIQFVLETDRQLFEDALQFAQQQVRKLIESHPDFYPMYTADGRWKHEGPVWTNWCDGFLPGMMWIFHKRNSANGESTRTNIGSSRPSATPRRWRRANTTATCTTWALSSCPRITAGIA